MSDLATFRDHARRMATAVHRPECLTRPRPWMKAQPDPGCTGCMTQTERALWKRLADEADAFLRREPEETLL